ncbi:MAG: GNAT family N-acetyltransferase [Bacteroidetes bacterium]|nr:GNAT family N-acetyltransferase [Bacteroidota bacterium]
MLQKVHSRAWPMLRLAASSEKELQRIPAKGPAILLLNRIPEPAEWEPLMGWLKQRRHDVVTAGLEAAQEDASPWTFRLFEPMLTAEGIVASHPKEVAQCLEDGNLVVLLPQIQPKPLKLPAWIPVRSRWKKKWLKFLQTGSFPVFPLHFLPARLSGVSDNKNDYLEYNKLTESSFRIGHAIMGHQLAGFKDIQRLDRYLSARLHSLCCVPSQVGQVPATEWPRVIHTPFDPAILTREIEALPPECLLLKQGKYQVFQATAEQIPHLLHEIGRLRELTFQAEGEGTCKMIDLDAFDAHYCHLFAWDQEDRRLAGAYRLGPGDELLRNQGKKGFYLHTLFHLKDEFLPYLNQSLELGRSFVVPAYQQQRLPLFLLWKGVTMFLTRNPQYCFLIGPVSISNAYSQISRSVMVRYIQTHHFDPVLAAMVRPRKAFNPQFGGLDAEVLLTECNRDTRTLDALISDMEPAHFRLPVLLRKYFAQNARIIGFNVDPNFSNALDGFMVCRTADLTGPYAE